MTKPYDEEMIEVAVKHLGHEVLAEAAPEDDGGDNTVSEAFDKKMRALIRRKGAWRAGSRTLRTLSRVAAILFVVVAVFSVAILSSEALRAQVINLLYQIGDEKGQITFAEVNPAKLPEGTVVPGYLPNGYRFVEANIDGVYIVSRYENEDGDEITIQQGPLNVEITVSQAQTAPVEIAGRTAYIITVEDNITVIFNDDSSSYILDGDIEVSQLLIIAESMLNS